jgi:SAM-dependent methyltransferase
LAVSWDEAYLHGSAPWDIGRPQPAFVALDEQGQIVAPVLDSGCGTGENALMLAERGLDVLGIDIAATAIERAQAKAAERGLAVEFVVGDVLKLADLGRRFATVVDCALFHTLDDEERGQYVASLAAATVNGGVVHLLCFSDRMPGTLGPRRITQGELRAAFAEGWRVERIDEALFDVKQDFFPWQPPAWLARIVRREPKSGAGR